MLKRRKQPTAFSAGIAATCRRRAVHLLDTRRSGCWQRLKKYGQGLLEEVSTIATEFNTFYGPLWLPRTPNAYFRCIQQTRVFPLYFPSHFP